MPQQEPMENFVFPDEIKAKLMKMNEEHFLHPLKLTNFCIHKFFVKWHKGHHSYSLDKNTVKQQTLNRFFVHKGVVNHNVL